MSELIRLSLSLEKPLYDQLERLVKQGEFANRSEFVRGMIREKLVNEQWQGDGETLATITMVYDHHAHKLSAKLIELQHNHHSNVLAATHVHLSEHMCAEMIMVRGEPSEIRHLADHMRQQKGVFHLALNMTSAGDHSGHSHPHTHEHDHEHSRRKRGH